MVKYSAKLFWSVNLATCVIVLLWLEVYLLRPLIHRVSIRISLPPEEMPLFSEYNVSPCRIYSHSWGETAWSLDPHHTAVPNTHDCPGYQLDWPSNWYIHWGVCHGFQGLLIAILCADWLLMNGNPIILCALILRMCCYVCERLVHVVSTLTGSSVLSMSHTVVSTSPWILREGKTTVSAVRHPFLPPMSGSWVSRTRATSLWASTCLVFTHSVV